MNLTEIMFSKRSQTRKRAFIIQFQGDNVDAQAKHICSVLGEAGRSAYSGEKGREGPEGSFYQ